MYRKNNNRLHVVPFCAFCSYFFLYQLIKLIELVCAWSCSSSLALRPPCPSPPFSHSSSWLWWFLWSWARWDSAFAQHTIPSLDQRGDSLFICRRCVGVSSGTSWRERNLHSAPSAALSSWWSSTQPSATLSVTQTSSWTPPVYCWSPSPVSPNSLSVYRTNIWVSLKLNDNQISWNMQDLHLNNW